MITADIIGIDILWYDQILLLPQMPAENASLRVESCSYQGGGKVCTALTAAGRQGISCGLLALCGNDHRSRFLADDLELHGVSTALLIETPGYEPGWSVVLSDAVSGGRRILWHNNDQQKSLSPADVDQAANEIRRARYLHLCRMDEAGCRAASIAKEAGVLVSFDADFYDPSVVEQLPFIDILIGSEDFYDRMFAGNRDFQTNCQKLADQGPRTVIFTFGSNGCRGIANGSFFSCPAFSVPVIDTVGAGDVFHGAYLAALCLGLSAGYEAARYASAVSAIKCTAVGGRAGIPSRKQIEEFLTSGTLSRKEIEERTRYYSIFR